MVEGTRKAVVVTVATGILVMGLLGVFAVPVHATSGSDPTYFLDCSKASSFGGATYNLQEGITPGAFTCAAGGLTASGKIVTPYTVGTGSNGAVYVNTAVPVSGTYVLVDCVAAPTCATSFAIASGSFSGTGTSSSCTGANSILFSGTSNTGAIVNSGDIFKLTLTISPGTVSFCSGGTGSQLTPTAVNTTSEVPQLGTSISVVVAVGLLAMLALKKHSLGSLQTRVA